MCHTSLGKRKEGVRMKITKLVHSCLLVEMPNRTALFDPGVMSVVDVDSLKWLDDIFVTHNHSDHFNPDLIKKLRDKFPQVRITVPQDALDKLEKAGVTDVSTSPPEGVRFFDAPHEVIRPWMPYDPPMENGIHYLDQLSHPGDSHSFNETMPILALPVAAPWGSSVEAAELGLRLAPKYILPIHDWHWSDQAREQMYAGFEQMFSQHGITFLKLENGVPVHIDL